jgi:hypothetical protein
VDIGFPGGKDKTIIVPLKGKLPRGCSRIRVRTGMQVHWDHVFLAAEAPVAASVITRWKPASAGLQYRGFSRMYRKGLYGPHWVDYSSVTTERKWRDLAGDYTRYGDVTALVQEADNKYVIMNAGDEISLAYSPADLPPLPEGWTRDYLLYSNGWLKDGDFNTAHSNTVEPLPFHGIRSYPPAPDDVYPSTPELDEYRRVYNTRRVTHSLPPLR